MENPEIDRIIQEVKSLNYSDRRKLYSILYTTGTIGTNLDDKLVLISLISITYLKLKEKNPKITPLDVLEKITGESKSESYFYKTLESISIIVEDFSYGNTTASSCGLKTSQEIINKIKELLNQWTPF